MVIGPDLYLFILFSYFLSICLHCRQRAPVENVPSASGTSHLGMIDIQAVSKSNYYDHIALLYLDFCLFYLYVFLWLTSSITQIWIK